VGSGGLWLINTARRLGLFVLAWGALVVSTIDNVIKPLIISRGSDLPFVLVLLGVLGGPSPSASSACSSARPARRRLRAPAGVGEDVAGHRAQLALPRHTGEQNATPFGPAPSGSTAG
jgi:hypothetical protein